MTPAPAAEPPAGPRLAGARPFSGARGVACLLLLVAASALIAVLIVRAPDSFSVNDRSRWLTIRALVDTGTYAIGRRYPLEDGTYRDRGLVTEPGWDTVDMVMHPNTGRFYSTKPPLLTTVLAGEYWVLQRAFGWQIVHDRAAVTATILLSINWLPFVVYLLLFARLVERLGTTAWGRLFVFATCAFGTFVSGFLVTLNNHTVAAAGALFAIYECLVIHLDGDRRWWRFLLAGLAVGWTACNELPAFALAAGVMLWLMWSSPRLTLLVALPAMLVPVAGYLYTQYAELGSIVPTYARTTWYLFEGSYWLHPLSVDAAHEGKLLYAANLLAGHTGILSLTPVLLLGWIGMARGAVAAAATRADAAVRDLARLTAALTVITFVFYVVKTNNYGGATVGPRWFFWLVPLWLLTMLPEADRWAASRWRRALAYLLLAVSIGSASYAFADPWRHSWLFDLLDQRGLISY